MKRNITLLIILSLIFVLGCKRDDEGLTSNDKPQTQLNIWVENTEVKTFEIINVKSSIPNLRETYSGTFGNTELQLAKVNDSILVFAVPDVEIGTYELKTELGNIEFNVSKTIATDPEETITNVFLVFDGEINSMANSPELDSAKSFKNEVAELYNSLTPEQKKEVVMFYEANKEIFQAFRQDLSTTYDAPTTFSKKSNQSNCPKTDFLSFYSCTADNLGSSINELGVSIKRIAEPIAYAAAIGKLASTTWYLGPSVWGLTAVGSSLAIGTAMYILITEVRPAWINFKSNLTPFLKANWILTKATFAVVTDGFTSNTETDLNIDAKFRTIEESDSDVSIETRLFISAYIQLSSIWNDFSKVLGSLPSFTSTEESVVLETNDITISSISNSNVELVSQNGEKVKFKSLSGNEEKFSFDITVNKEGFTQSETINAVVYDSKFPLAGVWVYNNFNDGQPWEGHRITFDAMGNSISYFHISYANNETSWSEITWNSWSLKKISDELHLTDSYYGDYYKMKVDSLDQTEFSIYYANGDLSNSKWTYSLSKQ